MTAARRHAWRPRHQGDKGFALIALLALVTMGALYFFISNLTPGAIEARRQQQTDEALIQARDAMLGYVLRYREANPDSGTKEFKEVYGYLPMPDLGTSRNTNAGCTDEGCEAANFSGNNANVAVIGRFPWRSLGVAALRDGHGECLWYIVSGGHQRIQQASPMNWDSLAHLYLKTANGSAELVPLLTDAPTHERPVAIIFSPGPRLSDQDRAKSADDNVDSCGGNYSVKNYLDPFIATTLGTVSNYFDGATNQASQVTSADAPKAVLAIPIQKRSDNTLWSGKNCPTSDSTSCETVANDQGLTLTSDLIFSRLRKRAAFRGDVNALLDRMVPCLRDQIAAGTLPDLAAPAYTSGGNNKYGRIPDLANSCYGEFADPKGYYPHYKDQLFVAACASGNCFDVTVDNALNTCPGVLVFSGQRSASQIRTDAQKNTPSNYLEDVNLASFTSPYGTSFSGPSRFDAVSANQSAHQDIVRCIPAAASFATVTSPVLSSLGYSQLASYDAASGTLTLGAVGVRSDLGAPAYALFGCAWTPKTRTTGSGLRSYFRVKIEDRGDGFAFALIDGDRNSSSVCGAARQHLGYSGNNDPDRTTNGNETTSIAHPKIGIEFDRTRAGGFSTSGNPLSAGRNDPDYTPPNNNDAHIGIVYWGTESAIATGTACNALLPNQCPWTGSCGFLVSGFPNGNCPAMRYCAANNFCYLTADFDDNAHARPATADPTAPTNPAAVDPFPSPPPYPPYELAPLDRLGSTTTSERDFHVRVELARSRTPEIREVRLVTSDDNLALSGLPTLDGVTVAAGNRILVARSGKPWLNGVYSAAAGNWTRHALEDEARELFTGNMWIVRQEFKDDGITAYPYRNTVWRVSSSFTDNGKLALAPNRLGEAVRAVASSNIALANLPILDGVTLVNGDRVLITGQTDSTQNGVYVAGAGAWIRASAESAMSGLAHGVAWKVSEGSSNKDSLWVALNDPGLTLGSAALVFKRMDIAIAKLRDPVRSVATGNISLSGLQTIDGVALGINDRVLVTAQSDPARNGIYAAGLLSWSRAAAEGTAAGLAAATPWVVNSGTTYKNSVWVLAASDEITLDVSPLTFKLDNSPYGLLSVITTRAWAIPEGVTDANWLLQLKAISRAMSSQTDAAVVRLGQCGVGDSCTTGTCGGTEVDGNKYCYTGIKQLPTNTVTVLHDTVFIHDTPQGACDANKRCSGAPLLKHGACGAGSSCPSGQVCGADNSCYDALHTCGSDNICYGESLRSMRLGFTNGQGTQDQVINITDFASTWLP
ncbi:MAG: hypothetical protein Q8O52_25190 [Sulfuritalea sp.]|nr:hypothetical protein [Sulfuritalea sp.]